MGTPTTRRWLVEGAVIVVSILLAFAVDAAWDARQERRVADAEAGSVVMVPDTSVVFAIRNPSPDAPTGALDALLASGDLRLISDPELRRMLAAWRFRLRDATEDDRLLRELSGPELRRIMSEDVNLLGPLGRVRPGELQRVTSSTGVRVTDPLRGVLPEVRGSSGLAEDGERALMLFVDSLLVRLRGDGGRCPRA